MSLEEENAKLRELLNTTPILIIDRRAARLKGEDVMLHYADAVEAWIPKMKEATNGR